MKNRFLITIVGVIILSSIIFVFIWNIPEKCDEACEIERRRIGGGQHGDSTLIKTTWVSTPVTSCGNPWNSGPNEKIDLYFDEYAHSVDDFDSSFWLDADRAVQHVITRYYEDLGISIHDVKTHHDRTMERTGKGCNTTAGATWFLQISHSNLDYFLNNGYDNVEFADVKSTESIMLECYALFNCDITNQYFKGCIGAKKDSLTINNICSNSNITIDNGCVEIVFPDGSKTIECD